MGWDIKSMANDINEIKVLSLLSNLKHILMS